MSLLEKTEACPVVVHGIVERLEPRWVVPGARVETLITIQVLESIKGEIPARERFTFRRGGGTIGDFTQTAPGLSPYEEGEEVILFLEPYLETYVEIGIGIGKYDVEVLPGGAKYVVHSPDVAAVRFSSDQPMRIEHHPVMEPVPLHDFLKLVRSYARSIPTQVVRPRKEGVTIKPFSKAVAR